LHKYDLVGVRYSSEQLTEMIVLSSYEVIKPPRVAPKSF